jgi:prepilin-type N-terminal cleavage/methylation domain-containing protein
MKAQTSIPKPLTRDLNNAGFTLVEILASFVIFSIILTVFSSVFLSSSRLQKGAFNIQQAEENASYILESMAKEIRVGKISGPDSNCPSSPVSTLSITHPVNGNIVYSLQGTSVQRTVNGTATIVSSNTVDFTRLQFCILGTEIGDKKQPRVTILAGIKSKKTQQQASIDIQTTVSQRFLSDQY